MAYINNRSNYNNNYKGTTQQQYKKSGATYTKINEGGSAGFYHVSAWKKTKMGLITASCFPLSRKDEKPKIHQGANNDFITYAVTLKQSNNIKVETYFALMNLTTRKIVIKELGLVISPNGSGVTASGKRVKGYFGQLNK